MTELRLLAPDGAPEIRRGDDLARLLTDLVVLADGDLVLVTSKVVSKAEARVVRGTREEAVADETVRQVARRGATLIVRTRHGLTLAAAGVDASNVEPGHVVLLPVDPDRSARALRARLADLTGCNVGVVVTDTAGRPWRTGQTDIAIGAAGVAVLEEFAGRRDRFDNELAVTAPAVADELAGAAELAQGKLGHRPFAVVRGRDDLVLARGEHGPGAGALVRPESSDMFGLGAREAVVAALADDPELRSAFGAAAPAAELADAVARVTGSRPTAEGDRLLCEGADPWVLGALARAHGWVAEDPGTPDRLRLRPTGP